MPTDGQGRNGAVVGYESATTSFYSVEYITGSNPALSTPFHQLVAAVGIVNMI